VAWSALEPGRLAGRGAIAGTGTPSARASSSGMGTDTRDSNAFSRCARRDATMHSRRADSLARRRPWRRGMRRPVRLSREPS